MLHTEKYGVNRASRKHNKRQLYFYSWKVRGDETADR